MKYPGSDIRYIPRIPLYGEEEEKPQAGKDLIEALAETEKIMNSGEHNEKKATKRSKADHID